MITYLNAVSLHGMTYYMSYFVKQGDMFMISSKILFVVSILVLARPSTSSVQVLIQSGHSPVTRLAWCPTGDTLVTGSAADSSILVRHHYCLQYDITSQDISYLLYLGVVQFTHTFAISSNIHAEDDV